MIAKVSQCKLWMQGMGVRAGAHRAKLIEAAKAKPGARPDPDAKPDPAAPPKPGGSRKEQRLDADAARAVALAPSFGFALELGLISLDHVAALGRVRNRLQVPVHESALLCVAKMRTAEDFVRWLITWDADRDREAGIDRAATQRRRRRVSFGRDSEDLGTMFAALSVLDATKVETTLRQLADELFHDSADDGTTMTQRLADALVLMAERSAGGGRDDEGSKSNRPTLVVICSEESLRGDLAKAGLGYTLDGHPVPASELRRLACDADIVPAFMGGQSQILDFGRRRRTASDPQRLALLTEYGGCIIDGCGCPAELIECHHLIPDKYGGRTDLENLAPMCNADHTRSHAEGWTYSRGPDGHLTVRTRHGTPIPTRPRRKPDERASTAHAPPGTLFHEN